MNNKLCETSTTTQFSHPWSPQPGPSTADNDTISEADLWGILNATGTIFNSSSLYNIQYSIIKYVCVQLGKSITKLMKN